MADYIDPLADPALVSSMEQQQLDVLRQAKLAEMLRKGKGAPGYVEPGAQGQMVSGHYVKPSVWQHVANAGLPLLQQYDAKRAGDLAQEKQSALSQTIAQMKAQWAGGMPQGTPGVAATPDQPAPPVGPPTEQGVGPATVGTIPGTGTPAIPAKPPTSAQILKHTIAGMNIPGNEKIAEMYNKGALADQTREDNQAFRSEQSALKLAQDHELTKQRLADSKAYHEALIASQNTNAAERERSNRALEELRRQDQANDASYRSQMLEFKKDAAKGKEPKPLPSTQATAWVNNEYSGKQLDEALKKAEANKGAWGVKNYVPDTAAQVMGYNQKPENIAARALIADIGSLKVHDRSGAAVTVAETPRLVPFIPKVTDTWNQVQTKLQNLRQELRRNQDAIQEFAGDMNYKMPTSRFGSDEGAKPPPGLTLPPGATYVGPVK